MKMKSSKPSGTACKGEKLPEFFKTFEFILTIAVTSIQNFYSVQKALGMLLSHSRNYRSTFSLFVKAITVYRAHRLNLLPADLLRDFESD